jgi:Domain of unknown function (DUF4253)
MARSRLPDDGELRLGEVTVPAGRRIIAGYGSGNPVAWATVQAVPDPGATWAALSGMHQQTGLVPFLLSGLDGETKRPWDNGEFRDPVDTSTLDGLDADAVLRSNWGWWSKEEWEDEEEAAEFDAQIAPFSQEFPGLAPAEDHHLTGHQRIQALSSLPAARVGLVAAARPADALPRLGWTGVTNRYETPLPVAAVLRSWEDRFGARLLEVGFDSVRLLVDRPPRSIEAAQRVAAEHWAFCDECAGQALHDIPGIAASLVNAPFWAFWWD